MDLEEIGVIYMKLYKWNETQQCWTFEREILRTEENIRYWTSLGYMIR